MRAAPLSDLTFFSLLSLIMSIDTYTHPPRFNRYAHYHLDEYTRGCQRREKEGKKRGRGRETPRTRKRLQSTGEGKKAGPFNPHTTDPMLGHIHGRSHSKKARSPNSARQENGDMVMTFCKCPFLSHTYWKRDPLIHSRTGTPLYQYPHLHITCLFPS